MVFSEEGIAIVEGDTHLSQSIIEHKRLDLPIVWELLNQLRPYIPLGGIVCDIGACLGDHTVAYAEMVGPKGRVYAFEPNPPALECLCYNVRKWPNVFVSAYALGHQDQCCRMMTSASQPGNLGTASAVPGVGVYVRRLDTFTQTWPRLDFMKIDVEGMEPMVLKGAEVTIAKHRPVILLEVNRVALQAQGSEPLHIYRLLDKWGYGFVPVCPPDQADAVAQLLEPEIDVVCFPTERFTGTYNLDMQAPCHV